MGTYIDQSDLNSVWTTESINEWADLDNDENAASITTQANAAIAYAEDRFLNELRATTYDTPTSVGAHVQHMLCVWAGEYLYKARIVRRVQTETTEAIETATAQADRTMTRIKAGYIELDQDRKDPTGATAPYSI